MKNIYVLYTALVIHSLSLGMESKSKVSLPFGNNIYKWQEEKLFKNSLPTSFFKKQCYQDGDGNICEDILCKEGNQEYRYLLFIGKNPKSDTGYLVSGTCMRYQKDDWADGKDKYCYSESSLEDSKGKIVCSFHMIGKKEEVLYDDVLNPNRKK